MLKKRLFLVIALCIGSAALPLAAQSGPSAQRGSTNSRSANDPDIQAMQNYKLTMGKVDQWAASNRAVGAYVKAHPDVKRPRNDAGDAKTFSEMEARARAEAPGFVKAIESTGMSFRDWWMVTGSLMSAYVAAQYQRPGMAASNKIPPENVEFVKANKEKLDALFAEFQKASAEMNGDKDNH